MNDNRQATTPTTTATTAHPAATPTADTLIDDLQADGVRRAYEAGYRASGGLIWTVDGRLINLPEADTIARRFGFPYAEHLVRALVALPETISGALRGNLHTNGGGL